VFQTVTMDVNPVAIAQCFINLVQLEFPGYGIAEPSEIEAKFAKELVKKFFDVLTDAVLEEDESLGGK